VGAGVATVGVGVGVTVEWADRTAGGVGLGVAAGWGLEAAPITARLSRLPAPISSLRPTDISHPHSSWLHDALNVRGLQIVGF
jgi:hypothetical protein